jgi:predicted permease
VTRTRERWIGIAVAAAAVAAMAVDHLIGTDDEPGESRSAEPIAFVTTSALALALTWGLFHFVVRRARGDPDRSARYGVVCSVLAVLTLPLLFLALPFAFAAAGIALGLRGREGRRRRVATATAVVGVLVVALGLAAYVAALVSS